MTASMQLRENRGNSTTQRPTSAQLPDQLPQLIEDSIRTTLKLGYTKLWVDFYCINQNDEIHVATQIAQMDMIYSKSEATIVAAACKTPHDGLPGLQPGSRKCSTILSLGGLQFAVVRPTGILDSRWAQRGW
jgi:hypothetical protein